ncbi:hypothetical protein [Pseudarthrobacter sulfonivorans]|nr:hypothetical protein [Pseudarthrobacter sulfonivorans]
MLHFLVDGEADELHVPLPLVPGQVGSASSRVRTASAHPDTGPVPH